MKAKIFDINGNASSEIDLPSQFSEEIRPDLIKRAVLAVQSSKIKREGVSPDAGDRYSDYVSKRRRKYKGIYGRGESRTPRKVMSRSGTQFHFVGASVPQTVGGRKAHPPKSTKIWTLKINDKERRKAIRSAIAATANLELVKSRGHRTEIAPITFVDDIENLSKTKDVEKLLESVKLTQELERVSQKKIRAGKGKNRGRPYKKKRGPLIIVSKKCKLMESAKNIPGVDIVIVKDLNAELLAPGTHIGRLAIYTKSSLDLMKNEKLFM
jgi:large subunit ribosomal protein L4e